MLRMCQYINLLICEYSFRIFLKKKLVINFDDFFFFFIYIKCLITRYLRINDNEFKLLSTYLQSFFSITNCVSYLIYKLNLTILII